MAELTYNGVTLNFISTQRISYEPVYDSLAGVDYLYTRIVIDCVAVVGDYPMGPATSGEKSTETVRRISHYLSTPRRGLIYRNGGKTLVAVTAATLAQPANPLSGAALDAINAATDTVTPIRDAKNGPTPSVSVNRIVGTGAIVVSFHVEANVVDCPGGATLQYLSYRWNETAAINDLGMTTRTRSGHLETRADMIANADQLRGLVTPPLERDFRRLSANYTIAADGRTLTYTFVDEEQYLMPPAPAARAEGRFSITSADGAAFYAECTLRLVAAKTVSKSVLMTRCVAIALAKIVSAKPILNQGAFVLMGTMTEDMYANDVTVNLRTMVQPAHASHTLRNSSAGTGAGTGNSGLPNLLNPVAVANWVTTPRPDGSSHGVDVPGTFDWLKVPKEHTGGNTFDMGSRGSAQLLLIAAALQDPCLRQTVLTGMGQAPTLSSGAGSVVPAQISITNVKPDDTTHSFRTVDDSFGVYEHYEIETLQAKEHGKFILPTAKTDAAPTVVQLHPPYETRRVNWRAIKLGSPPQIPKGKIADTKWELIREQLSVMQLEPIADGSVMRYQVSGCYDYVCLESNRTESMTTLRAAVPPWVDARAQALATNSFSLISSILDSLPRVTGSYGLTTVPPGLGGTTASLGPIIPGVNG